jgi:hypothetical protein
MIGFAKIIGDLIGGYVVHIAGIGAALLVGSEVWNTLSAAAQPITAALN